MFDERRTIRGVPRTLHHPPADTLELTGVLHALADPVRLEIVRNLEVEGECRCGAFDLPVTKSTRTHHFRVLRESGVIEQRAEGTALVNRLRREELDERFPGLLDSVLSAR
jgi:DNA-binding transcriptional ArsR family regulator